jgi:predicted nucleotidyltransferase
LAALKLRDRDAIITEEGLIFRVFGYSHPSTSYVCDVEYAPLSIFKSNNPKAFRNEGKNVFYKFYEDEGWKFVESKYPRYMIFHEMLRKNVAGVNHNDVHRVRRPEEILQERIGTQPKDELLTALNLRRSKTSSKLNNQSKARTGGFRTSVSKNTCGIRKES